MLNDHLWTSRVENPKAPPPPTVSSPDAVSSLRVTPVRVLTKVFHALERSPPDPANTTQTKITDDLNVTNVTLNGARADRYK